MGFLNLRRNRRTPPPSQPAAETHDSPALGWLVEELDRAVSPEVLDLGAASAGNIAFFARFEAKLYINSLNPGQIATGQIVTSQSATGAEGESVVDWPSLLGYQPEARFDLILTWDLFNYLGPAEIRSLVGHLARSCRPGARLFSLISTRSQVPASPLAFEVVDGNRLLYRPSTALQRPGSYHKEPQLLRWMPGFTVRKTFLLRHGVQEYVFERAPVTGGC